MFTFDGSLICFLIHWRTHGIALRMAPSGLSTRLEERYLEVVNNNKIELNIKQIRCFMVDGHTTGQ